jgi:S1-C subfamily serine protease
VKIAAVNDDGGAKKSGLKPDDVIKKVNNVKISKFSELRGQLTAKRPGDFVDITLDRDGELLKKRVELGKKKLFISETLKVYLKDLTTKELKKYKLSGGAKIVSNRNKSLDYYGVKDGYIITKVNKKEVVNASEAVKLIDASYPRGAPIYLEVINLDGEKERYAFR